MLTKRTNILFDEELWKKLLIVSRVNKKSVGQLVREAVSDRYCKKENDERSKAYFDILKIRKRFKSVDYKELINAGRKY